MLLGIFALIIAKMSDFYTPCRGFQTLFFIISLQFAKELGSSFQWS